MDDQKAYDDRFQRDKMESWYLLTASWAWEYTDHQVETITKVSIRVTRADYLLILNGLSHDGSPLVAFVGGASAGSINRKVREASKGDGLSWRAPKAW